MNRRKAVDTAIANRSAQVIETYEVKASLEKTLENISDNKEKQEIARKSAKLVQDHLATKLSGIVTKSLSTVFEEPMEFVAQFVERRGVSECDLFLRIGGHEYDILKGQGGGIADVCSMTLQMAFIMLAQVDRVLIIDEPARHMDIAAQERFISVLQELCKELNFTIIMVTHSQPFTEGADKVFKIIKKGGISRVYN